jgi:hypothetical protein
MSAATAAPASSAAWAKDAFVVGVTISLVTITDEDIMGEIFAYDPLTTCLVLRMCFQAFLSWLIGQISCIFQEALGGVV